MIKVLHICADEKFIDGTISMFVSLKEVFSVFYVFTSHKDKKVFLVKNPNIITFSSFDEIPSITNENSPDLVMLHALFIPYHIALKINHPIIWSTWGSDIYSDIKDPIKKIFHISLYKFHTRTLLRNSIKKNNYCFFHSLKKMIHLHNEQRRYVRIVKKTSYFSTVLPEEFEKIKQKYPKAKYCPFHYFSDPASQETSETKVSFVSNRILLGNSNDPTNNHYDILKKLNSLQTPLEIIIPFSYPNNNTTYKERLIEVSSLFKNLKITFLHNFLDRNKYFDLLNSCGNAIFGHLRQQAIGNVLFCLATGKKVFFYDNSILSNHYHNQGYTIFSIDNDLNKTNLYTHLSLPDQKNNYSIFLKEWDYNQQLKELQFFFDHLKINK